jgi:hypothetical protein
MAAVSSVVRGEPAVIEAAAVCGAVVALADVARGAQDGGDCDQRRVLIRCLVGERACVIAAVNWQPAPERPS